MSVTEQNVLQEASFLIRFNITDDLETVIIRSSQLYLFNAV